MNLKQCKSIVISNNLIDNIVSTYLTTVVVAKSKILLICIALDSWNINECSYIVTTDSVVVLDERFNEYVKVEVFTRPFISRNWYLFR